MGFWSWLTGSDNEEERYEGCSSGEDYEEKRRRLKGQYDLCVVGYGVVDPQFEWQRSVFTRFSDDPGVVSADEDCHLDFLDVFGEKANRNCLVVGTSGSGKTTFMNAMIQESGDPTLAVSFKRGDQTLRLDGFDVVDVSECLPDPFSSREAFVTAYLMAYPTPLSGPMASNVPTVVKRIWSEASNWSELVAVADEKSKRYSDMRGSIAKSFSDRLRDDLSPGGELGYVFEWDFESDIVLDFGGLNDSQKSFFAELLLQNLWRQMEDGSVPVDRFTLAVDEAHRVLRRSAGVTSVLDLMSREVRHLGGRVVFCTQNISDVYENVRNQLDTQFVSKTTHKEDLQRLNQIHSNSARFIKRLWRYEFVDVQALNFLDRFFIYRLNELPEYLDSPNYIASETLRNEESVKPTVKRQERGRETPDKGRETKEKERETQKAASGSGSRSGNEAESSDKAVRVDKEGLENDLMRLLNERAYYVSELGRELEDKYDKDANRLKVDCHALLKDLTSSGAVMKADLEDRWGNRLVMYWSKEKGVSAFHKALSRKAKATILEQGGEIEKGKAGSDFTALVNDSEIGIECETGLKSGLEKFKEKVEERIDHFDQVWIITPTKKKRKKYQKALESVRNLRFKTLKTLKSSIN